MQEPPPPPSDPIRIQVTGNLDLHTFRPRDLPDLLPAWFEECRARGIPTVRVIHGKGTGTLRSGVHALLPRLTDHVASWTHPAPAAAGGWGVTLVQLRGHEPIAKAPAPPPESFSAACPRGLPH